MARSTFSLSLATLVLVAAPAGGQPPSGVQVTPDGEIVLVSKDVGAERWAIARNPSDGTVTGNVFRLDGAPPQFLWCEETASSADTVSLRCLGADPCPLSSCDEGDWALVAEVEVPASFFAPPAGGAAARTSSPGGRTFGASPSSSPAGVQPAPDLAVDLVSKDVGTERWAIRRRRSDGVITGNVFFADGGEPRFVWCRETRGGDVLRVSCFGADRCEAGPCVDAWSPIADVDIPASFFAPPSAVSESDVVDALLEHLGEQEGGVAVLVALDRGYELRQIVRAALSKRLLPSGAIARPAGGVEEPVGDPTGVFSGARVQQVGGDEPLDPDEIWLRLNEATESSSGQESLAVLLGLAALGYDAEQLAAAATGVYTPTLCGVGTPRDSGCLVGAPVLSDGDGEFVEPANESVSFLIPEPLCPLDGGCEDDPLPWSFSGTLSIAVTLTAPWGSRSLDTPCPIGLVLLEDGTIEGEYTCPTFIRTICPDEAGAPGGFVIDSSGLITQVRGTWTPDARFELDAVNTATSTPYRGSFGPDELSTTRDLGERTIENCGVTITGMNFSALETLRDLD